MTSHRSRIEYGDGLRLQPQLSRIVDRAVVRFVNRLNGEPDHLEGFDDPLFHLPKLAESTSRMHAFRRWHGADWWMVLHEDAREVPNGCTVTRRVTIVPDSIEPDTLDFLPDLVVTRGGARFVLPDYQLHYDELGQRFPLFGPYGLRAPGNYFDEHMEDSIIEPLSQAWKYTSLFDPSDATVLVSS